MEISFDKGMGYQILDSGDRTEFESGAVRDMRQGKGRMDLIPWDCSAMLELFGDDPIMLYIIEFFRTNNTVNLVKAMTLFASQHFGNMETAMLELAQHFEAGAVKYGERNWEKGIPTHCYIDSALRHYMKYRRGDIDERHDRAFVWNLICLVWTQEHLPKVNDLHAPVRLSMRLKRAFSRVVLWWHDMKLMIRSWLDYKRTKK